MVNGFRYYRALESVSIASALSTALTIYPCQIRVHQRWQSKLQLPTARKKEWRPVTTGSSPHAVTCQHCETHYFSGPRTWHHLSRSFRVTQSYDRECTCSYKSPIVNMTASRTVSELGLQRLFGTRTTYALLVFCAPGEGDPFEISEYGSVPKKIQQT